MLVILIESSIVDGVFQLSYLCELQPLNNYKTLPHWQYSLSFDLFMHSMFVCANNVVFSFVQCTKAELFSRLLAITTSKLMGWWMLLEYALWTNLQNFVAVCWVDIKPVSDNLKLQFELLVWFCREKKNQIVFWTPCISSHKGVFLFVFCFCFVLFCFPPACYRIYN